MGLFRQNLLIQTALVGAVGVLAGCNNSQLNSLPATSSEIHYQGGGAPPVDVLFIVDNSGSMSEEQANLANNFQQFIGYFQNLGLDYHLGVTTTDDLKNPVDEDGKHYDPGAAGKLVGNPNILTPQTQNLVGDFSANANVGIAGWRSERGLENAKLALSNPAVSGANAGFLRENAILAIIIVSDEEDQSIPFGTTEPTKAEADDPTWRAAHLTPVQDYVNFFVHLKHDNPAMVNLSAIVGPDGGCATSNSPGLRYIAAANALHGVVGSICDSSFGPILDQIGATVTGLATAFPLQFTPDPSQITVSVDGTVIPQGANGWTYNSNTNTISFAASAVPPSCAVVEIDYGVADYGNGITTGNNELPPVQCGVDGPPPGGGNTLEGGAFSCDVTTTGSASLGTLLGLTGLALGLILRRRS